MNIAFRLLLTPNATSLLIIIFLVQKGYTLGYFLAQINGFTCLSVWPNAVSYVLYFLMPLLSTKLSIYLSSWLGKDEFKHDEIATIAYANNSFLPSYLGYFFVALSIDNWEALWFVYSVLFLFTFMSQALYFNPLFLIFRYEFYNVTTKEGTTIFLISRHKYRKPNELEIPVAHRINNYTFIERG